MASEKARELAEYFIGVQNKIDSSRLGISLPKDKGLAMAMAALIDNKYAPLVVVLEQYEKAAIKFINKVESGRAQSKETYADLKACHATAEALLKPKEETDGQNSE